MNQSTIHLGLGAVGRHLGNFGENRQSFVEPAQISESGREVEPSFTVVRQEHSGSLIAGDRLVQAILFAQAIAQVEPGQAELRMAFNGPLIGDDRVGHLAPLLAEDANVVVGRGVIGTQRDGPPIMLERLAQSADAFTFDAVEISTVGSVRVGSSRRGRFARSHAI